MPSLFVLALLLLSIVTLINGFQLYGFNAASFRSQRAEVGMTTTSEAESTRLSTRNELLELIASTPRNEPTSKSTTSEILSLVKRLEPLCPTPTEDVLRSLAGTWELLWTAQDKNSPEWAQGPLRTWINPLENQSYSNNPNSSEMGRFSPVLPRNIQDKLEELGVIDDTQAPVRSTQSIDLQKKRVRNVVSVVLPALDRRASLTVDVRFKPNEEDARRVDVKFESCRLFVPKTPIDVTFPLGIFGPTGWLRTDYIDDDIRITRGHKGSVFILSRASKKKAE